MTTTTAQDKYNEAFKEYSECNDYAQSFEADRESFAARQAEINKLAAELATLRSALAADKAMNREDAKEAKDLRKAAEKAMKAAKREADREAKRKAKASKKTEGKAKTEAKGKAEGAGRKPGSGTLPNDILIDLLKNYGLKNNMDHAHYKAVLKAYYKKNHPDLSEFIKAGDKVRIEQTAKCQWAATFTDEMWRKSRFYTKPEYRKAA